MSKLAGGTSSSTYNLVKSLNYYHCDTDILTSDNKFNDFIGHDSFIHTYHPDIFLYFRYDRKFRHTIPQIGCYDVYHTNGLWQDLNLFTCKFAHSIIKPYVISLHGMMYPHALSIKPFRKKLMRFLCYDNLLQNASCIHVTSKDELQFFRELGFNTPIALIPNIIPIDNKVKPRLNLSTKRIIGFLGRLNPIKNIPALIQAWKNLGKLTNGSELHIMGRGEVVYEQMLKSLALQVPENNITFYDFSDGERKMNFLSSLTALCLPSLQENFGMTVVEALSMGTPVIASKNTPWSDLNSYNAGWWGENSVDELSENIKNALLLSDNDNLMMRQNAKKLYQEHYSEEILTPKMISVYSWLCGLNDRPTDVIIQ